MTLAAFQRTLKSLLMTPEGQKALASQKALQNFVNKSSLSKAEKADLAKQPLNRLNQYALMVQGNVEETLETIFPFTHLILGDEWDEVVIRYFWQYPNYSYRMMGAAQGFPEFIAKDDAIISQYPFLSELAQYEWAEAELLSSENQVIPETLQAMVPKSVDDLAQFSPVLNTVSTLFHFAYPIPGIISFFKEKTVCGLTDAEVKPKTTLVWIYRASSPYCCRFFEVNPMLAAWLETIKAKNTPQSYQDSIQPLFEAPHVANSQITPDYFYPEFLNILSQLLEKGVLLGSTPIA